MSKKKWVVDLSAEERDELGRLISKGRHPATKMLKARILLKADQGYHGPAWSDGRIVEALETNSAHIARVRRKFVEEGLAAVFARKKRETPPRRRVFDGSAEASFVALACSEPPPGHARWSIRLLAQRVVELEIVDAVHFNTVGRTLKKTLSNRI